VGQDDFFRYPSKHPRCSGSIHTGHQDIRTFFSNTTAVEPTTNTTPNTHRHESTDHQHRTPPYPPSSTRHSPATSARKNPARYDLNRHSPDLSWAQWRQSSLSDYRARTHQNKLTNFNLGRAGSHSPPVRVGLFLHGKDAAGLIITIHVPNATLEDVLKNFQVELELASLDPDLINGPPEPGCSSRCTILEVRFSRRYM
jgi:hypothetical protein